MIYQLAAQHFFNYGHIHWESLFIYFLTLHAANIFVIQPWNRHRNYLNLLINKLWFAFIKREKSILQDVENTHDTFAVPFNHVIRRGSLYIFKITFHFFFFLSFSLIINTSSLVSQYVQSIISQHLFLSHSQMLFCRSN